MNPSEASAGGRAAWLRRHRRETLDLAALGLSLVLTRGFGANVPPAAAVCALVVAALMPLRQTTQAPTVWREFLAAMPRRVATVLVTGAFLRYGLSQNLNGLWFGAVWPAIACLLGLDWVRIQKWIRSLLDAQWTANMDPQSAQRLRIGHWLENQRWIRSPTLGEFVRSTLLGLAALWLMRGFLRSTLHGTGDALWYATMLADATTQARAGVFPVWVGQSIYQFNGAIYPLRVAPAFHYLGVLLDTVTFHRLGVFALQNLLLTLLAAGAMATAYLGLRALLPGKKWLAAGLAALFLSCPGVLGISYNTDLYMSWTTLPVVPLVWFATVRSFQNRGATRTLALLGASLGCCWWGHSPIALWSTLFAGAAQIARICIQWREGNSWTAILAGGLVFAAVAAYPIASVIFFPPEPGVNADSFQRATAGTIVYFLRRAFPATFLPLSAVGRSLGDFQLGYSLWALLILAIWAQHRAWRPDSGVPLAVASILAILLLPIPGIDLALWTAVPAFIRDTTGNWVMNRLYLPLAAATVFGSAACASAGLFGRGLRYCLFAFLVAGGCVWSFSEAAKFATGSRRDARTADSAVDDLRPENVAITRFAYLVFPKVPGTFTNGVADPNLENCLLAKDTMALIASNADAALAAGQSAAAGDFQQDFDVPAGTIDPGRKVQIEPGRSYLLAFDFARPADIHGVLQIKGPHFFREYLLPEYGGPTSFGAGGSHSAVLPIWTTDGPEGLSIRFIPERPIAAGQPAPHVAHIKLVSFDRSVLPERVDSWIPYRASVQSPAAAWLETPRMYQIGYQASVDGQAAAVRKSPDGLVCVAVPKGASSVELAYVAPSGLKFLFWLSFLAIIGAFALGAVKSILHLLGAPSPAKASEAIRGAQ